MNDEFLQWLREQLDDDESAALGAKGDTAGRWTQDDGPPEAIVLYDKGGRLTVGQARHIARHDPARVLREIEAKRGVLRQYTDLREQVRNPVSAENRTRARALQGELGDVLRLLALPYADRPGYSDEWRP